MGGKKRPKFTTKPYLTCRTVCLSFTSQAFPIQVSCKLWFYAQIWHHHITSDWNASKEKQPICFSLWSTLSHIIISILSPKTDWHYKELFLILVSFQRPSMVATFKPDGSWHSLAFLATACTQHRTRTAWHARYESNVSVYCRPNSEMWEQCTK